MLVRSQAKTMFSIGMSNVKIIDTTVYATTNENMWVLGKYSTGEKATRVKEMLERHSTEEDKIFMMPKDDELRG